MFRRKPFHKMLMWCHCLIITHGSQIILVHFTCWVKARDRSFDFHLMLVMDLLPCSCPVPACLHFNRISSALWIVGGAVSGKRLIHLKHKTPLLLTAEEDAIVHLKKIKQASLFFGLPSSVSYACRGSWDMTWPRSFCALWRAVWSLFNLPPVHTISVAAHWWEISLSCVACWLEWTMKCSFFCFFFLLPWSRE